jgi:hypothetical protein
MHQRIGKQVFIASVIVKLPTRSIYIYLGARENVSESTGHFSQHILICHRSQLPTFIKDLSSH